MSQKSQRSQRSQRSREYQFDEWDKIVGTDMIDEKFTIYETCEFRNC